MTSAREQQPNTEALELLRAYHDSLQELLPLLTGYIEVDASDDDIASVYELCGNTWEMLTAIHAATEQRAASLEATTESAPLQLVQPPAVAVVPTEKKQQDPTTNKTNPEGPEKPMISYAASLTIPADFDSQLVALMDQYDGRVNIAAVIRHVLCTERLSNQAFRELSNVLVDRCGLKHTGRGFFMDKKAETPPKKVPRHTPAVEQPSPTIILDHQIRAAIGSPAPTWKPKQRGRY